MHRNRQIKLSSSSLSLLSPERKIEEKEVAPLPKKAKTHKQLCYFIYWEWNKQPPSSSFSLLEGNKWWLGKDDVGQRGEEEPLIYDRSIRKSDGGQGIRIWPLRDLSEEYNRWRGELL